MNKLANILKEIDNESKYLEKEFEDSINIDSRFMSRIVFRGESEKFSFPMKPSIFREGKGIINEHR